MIIEPKQLAAEFGRVRTGSLNKKGLITGFDCFDGPLNEAGNIRIAKQYMSIWTGYPSSGKSEFLDAILVNMAILHGWKTLVFSPENLPLESHMAKLSEKYMGRNILTFSKDDNRTAMAFLSKHFAWLDPDAEAPEFDLLIEQCKRGKKEFDIDCFVIDPWNSVLHDQGTLRSDQYLQKALTIVTSIARRYDIHFAIVAHPKMPTKDKKGNYPTPDLYSIADGAMWRNKCDYGFVIDRPDQSENVVDIHIQKRKFKWMGTPGIRCMDYDIDTGRFKPRDAKEFTLPHEVEAPF